MAGLVHFRKELPQTPQLLAVQRWILYERWADEDDQLGFNDIVITILERFADPGNVP
jgi:hypothetical protein